MRKIIKLNNWMIQFYISEPRTVWSDFYRGAVDKQGLRLQYRKDILLGFTRTWHRPERCYIYSFYCGRVSFSWVRIK